MHALCNSYMYTILVAEINNCLHRWDKRRPSWFNTFLCLIWLRDKEDINDLEGKNVIHNTQQKEMAIRNLLQFDPLKQPKKDQLQYLSLIRSLLELKKSKLKSFLSSCQQGLYVADATRDTSQWEFLFRLRNSYLFSKESDAESRASPRKSKKNQ